MKTKKSEKKAFTLVELLVVIGILAVLAVVVLYTLNPAQLSSQGRDSNRVADLTTLNQNIALYHETVPAGSLGMSGTEYVSIPDPNATSTAGTNCAGLGLPSIASGTYHCAASSTYRNTNGTGWVPINFSVLTGNPLATLPIDPINTTSSREYYVYVASGTQYEVTANPESPKTSSSSLVQGNNLALQQSLAPQYVWVADTGNSRVEKFDSTGNYISQFSSTVGGNGQNPFGITIDPSGNIYVDDIGDHVKKFDSTGNYISQFGSYGTGNGQFSQIGAIANDSSGNVYVGDGSYAVARVEKFDSTGNYISQFGSRGAGTGQFIDPWGIAFDASGDIYVLDSIVNNRVEKFDSNGNYLLQFGSTGSGNGQLSNPRSIAIDPSGNVYVADSSNNRVEKFDSNGNYLLQFGSTGSGNGQFSNPNAISIDASGNVYVLDYGNNRVEKFDSNGNYLLQFGSTGSGNGQFSNPDGIFVK